MYYSITLHRCHKNMQTTLLNETKFTALKEFNILYIKNNRHKFKPYIIEKDEAMYLYKKCAERDGIKYFDIAHNKELINIYVYEHISNEYYVFVGDMDIEKLTNIVKYKKDTNIYKYLTHILYRNSKYNSEQFHNNKSETLRQLFTYPYNSHIIPSNIVFEEINDKLYNYQKENIKWMLYTEYNTINRTPIYFSNDELEIGEIFFHKYQLTLTEDFRERNFMYINGGMLADSPGLGKTVQILSLIQLHRAPNEYNDIASYDNIEIVNIMKICTYTTNMTYMSYLLKRSKTTLIIVPAQVYCQWQNEIEKWYNTSKYNENILYSIGTETEYNNYMKIRTQIDPQIILLSIDIYILYKSEFNSIKWWRLIIDEAHELLNRDEYYFKELYAEYKWLLTGTPNANRVYFENYIKCLCLGTFHGKYLLETNPKLMSIFYNKMFRRNTYDTIRNDVILPEVNINVKMLNFTDNERQIYNSTKIGIWNNEYQLRQLCCHPLLLNKAKKYIVNCQTIEDIKKGLLQYFEKERDDSMIEYINCKNNISRIEGEIYKNKENKEKNDKLILELEKTKGELIEIEKLVENKQNMYLYSSTINELEELKNREDYPECILCLNNYENRDIVVINCGHKYCSECVEILNERRERCPLCRCEIDNRFNYRINLKALKNGKEYLNELDVIIDKEGTKIGHIIEYIKKNREKYILLFCEWEDILLKIREILMRYKIGSLYCKGDVYEQHDIINKYQNGEGEERIMLICSTNYVSGVSLTRASDIIFVNPLIGEGEYEYINPYEEQAIGRLRRIGQMSKDVNVIKYIIKDTIEEDTIKMCLTNKITNSL